MPDSIENSAIYVDDGRKRICFEIGGTHYSANISISKLLMPMVEVNENFDYRGYVSSELVKAVDSQQKPTIEQVISQNDAFYIQIFNCFLANNTEFYAVYDKISCTEICEHYISAYCRYCIRNLPQASALINDKMVETISVINETSSYLLQNIDLSFFNALAEKINAAISWYANNADTIMAGIETALASFNKISQSILNGISEYFQDIHIPEISEERKKELLESYEQWGKYGWTVPPFAEIGCFNNRPLNLIEADKIALQFCRKADMQMLFSELENMCTRKRDIREAINCYNARQYKACSLILFSIIDSRLIRLQGRKTDKYSVGAGAIAKYKKIVEQQTSDSGKLYLSLSYANLFPCLFSVFEDTNNFSKKTTVINRNYLDHGMSCKTVRKKDCIKLFLLLYNLLELITVIK